MSGGELLIRLGASPDHLQHLWCCGMKSPVSSHIRTFGDQKWQRFALLYNVEGEKVRLKIINNNNCNNFVEWLILKNSHGHRSNVLSFLCFHNSTLLANASRIEKPKANIYFVTATECQSHRIVRLLVKVVIFLYRICR